MGKRLLTQKVTDVRHWNDTLFSFSITRDPDMQFRTGEFVMIGLCIDDFNTLRAYSIASPSQYSEHLEFLSIMVPEGELTPELCKIQPGDEVLVNRKTTGTLVLDNLEPGRTLYLIATGTGLAPFMGTIRDDETYEKFDQVVLVHTVRHDSDLAYYNLITDIARGISSETPKNSALYYIPTVTGNDNARGLDHRRCTDLFQENQLKFFCPEAVPEFNPREDRVMICGNTDMNKQMIEHCESLGMTPGLKNQVGTFVYERAFVG